MNYHLVIISLFLVIKLNADNSAQIQQTLHDSTNKFTSVMFNKVANDNVGKSFVISAFSVLPLLGQFAIASVGQSRNEILRSIGIPNTSMTIQVFSYMNSLMQSVKEVQLKSANKVYVAKNYQLNQKFAYISQNVFKSEIENIDFTKPNRAADEINRWVERQTNNQIKDLVDSYSIHADLKAILVNAIYFKGNWVIPFPKENTVPANFHVTKDKVTKVNMMHREGEYGYLDSNELNAQILEIPYKGDEMTFVVVLPHDVEGITLEEKLKDLSVLDNAIGDLFEVKVKVYLPRFKLKSKTNLIEVLRNMNIKKLFQYGEAGLDNLLMGHSDLFVEQASQNAFLEVNEEGTAGSAGNDFANSDRILSTPRDIVFRADHPFLFYLYHGKNVLFNGAFYA